MDTFIAYKGTNLGYPDRLARDTVVAKTGLGTNSGQVKTYQMFCLQHPIAEVPKNTLLNVTLIKQYIGQILPLFFTITANNGIVYYPETVNYKLQVIDDGHTLKIVGTNPNDDAATIPQGILRVFYAICQEEIQ